MIELPIAKIIVAILLPGVFALAIAAFSMSRDEDDTAGWRAVSTVIAMVLIPAVVVGIAYLAGIIEVKS